MEVSQQTGLRAAQQQRLRGRIIDAALALSALHGFDATTVEEIAARAETSPRTVFRHFGSKDGIILAKFEDTGRDLLAQLRQRPDGEDVWEALRRTLDYFIEYAADEDKMLQSARVSDLIAASESLRSAYREQMDHIQIRVAEAVEQRYDVDRWSARALVAAAFACMSIAGEAATVRGSGLADELDSAMGAVRCDR